MSEKKNKKFSDKHPGETPDKEIEEKIKAQSKGNEVACAVAFEISKEVGKSPDIIGRTIDTMDFKIIKCQLGLFGYQPERKKVKPVKDIDENVKSIIEESLVDGRVSCKRLWEISDRLNLGKMEVSGVCEALKIKIKPCQLGAF